MDEVEGAGWRRMRRVAARMLPALRWVVPLAAIASGTVLLLSDAAPHWTDFSVIVVLALVLGGVLSAIVRTRARKSAGPTRRDAIAVVVVAAGGALWCAGILGLAADWGIAGSWFVYGLFALAVATGLLVASTIRRR